jgi:hydrogenase nickel incorporation protein HypB
MCKTAGNGDAAGDGHAAHAHHHGHGPGHEGTRVRVERAVLDRNDRLAEYTRGWLAGRGVLALNLVSSPGSGKTTLLERTVREFGPGSPLYVIEGDQETDCDARRIRAAGGRAVQVNTGVGCHLDAAMVRRALDELNPPPGAVLFIENVGNLVCPALFDLGERAKVVVCSVPEGDDKPLKYPHMFRAGGALLLNKTDLLPHVPFDVGRFLDNVRQVNPGLKVFPVSALRGDGLADWYAWLEEQGGRPTAAAA